MTTQASIDTEGDRASVVGRLGLLDFRRVIAALHTLTQKKGYHRIRLDFARCTAAFAGPTLAICVTVQRLRRAGVDVSVELPTDPESARLFHNTNWAHFLDPQRYAQSVYRGSSIVPGTPFSTPAEQQGAVNRMVEALLRSTAGLAREDLAAIEWSLNEITDNVLVHSSSELGGIVQLNYFRRKRQIEFIVSDAGLGIPATLRGGRPEILSDSDALDRAIREGITRDPTLGQGNGLFGTFEVTRVSGGWFHIHSGHARLDHDQSGLHVRHETIPFLGTLLVGCIDLSQPSALGEALKFGGVKFQPTDYIENHHETHEGIAFNLPAETQSFGSRLAGEPVRRKLQNLLRMNPGSRIVVDLSAVPLVSSSFADEVFGKLFVSLGATTFMARFELRGVSDTVRSLIDLAIVQRTRQR